MKEKQKPQLDCGVDGINIRFASNYELEQDVYRFTRNKRNKEIEYATLKKIKATNEQIEYALYVNLPKILRNTNIQPYSVLDCTKYASVYQFLFDQLTQLFGMNIPELIVTGIECSFSYTLADKELLKPKISNRAMDENVRLKANVWIAEKLVGKSYSIADVEGNVQDKDINIVLNVRNATSNDSEVWEEDNSDLDDWGKDLYTPSH